MAFREFIIPNRFKGRVTIVTGAGSGIGREIAIRFAKEGSNVVIPDTNLNGAQETARMIEEIGCKALPIQTDVSNPESVKEMVKKAVETFTKIDILVNNAGIVVRESLLETTDENWNKEMAVDLGGVAFCTKYVVKEMIKTGGGKVVNISSTAGLIGAVSPAYTAAKGGVISLTRVLAGEFAPYKINVNTICPGFTATPMNEPVRKMGLESILAKQIPQARWATAKEIASVAAFLASDEADHLTGVILPVDGGATCYKDCGDEYREFDKKLKKQA